MRRSLDHVLRLLALLFAFLIQVRHSNFLIKINHARRHEVYLVDDTKMKHLIMGMDTLTGLGYDLADIKLVSESKVASFADGDDLNIGGMSAADQEKYRKAPGHSNSDTMSPASDSHQAPLKINPYYIGLKCYENSMFPPELCDFRLSGFCSINVATCALWRNGQFVLPSSNPRSLETARASTCSDYYSGKFEHGRWQADNCPVFWFQSEELRHVLVNSKLRIALYGDSTVRQVFLRLIFYLRGYENMAEHYFHQDAIYKANHTHDELVIGEFSQQDWYEHTDDYYPFSIEYIWARNGDLPFIKDFIANPPPTRLATFHILGGVTHTNAGYNVELLTKLDPHARFPLLRNITFFSMVNRGVIQNSTVCNYDALPVEDGSVNYKLLQWMRLQQKHFNKPYIPFYEMDQISAFPRNNHQYDAHYQCGILDMFDTKITTGIKSPANGDCRDIFNLNLVMILFNIIIKAQ